MTSPRLPARAAWTVPLLLCVPLLTGADGNGCTTVPGSPFGMGGHDAGVVQDDGGPPAQDGGVVCTASSCATLGATTLAKLCPDGTTLSATLCEDLGNGQCGWGFPACPSDGGPADAGTVCPLGSQIACNLPDCLYGVLPQTDAHGCPACGICAPAPDAGADASCDCGPPPPVAACPGSGGPSVTCETNAGGTCSWLVGSCPSASDGGSPCASTTDCPTGQVCGFLESAGCSAQGACFVAPEVTCDAIALACACDDTEINVACNGFPSGYASKPYLHSGSCN